MLNPDLDLTKAKEMVVKFVNAAAFMQVEKKLSFKFPENGRDMTGSINQIETGLKSDSMSEDEEAQWITHVYSNK